MAQTPATPAAAAGRPAEPPAPRRDIEVAHPSVVVVAASTGGPAALEVLLGRMHGPLQIPVLIVQHMPSACTKFLAERLAAQSGLACLEAQHDDRIVAGNVYLAPGDYHMRVSGLGGEAHVLLDQGPKLHGVRPAADHLFASVAALYGKGAAGFVLTGMGQDGCVGARSLRRAGGVLMIQDKSTSAVWGMPGAVHASGGYDRMGSIDECAKVFARLCCGQGSAA